MKRNFRKAVADLVAIGLLVTALSASALVGAGAARWQVSLGQQR